MAKTDNLIHYLSDVANAIREKEGSTDPINAQDFSERIRSISAGSDPGFADYYYFENTSVSMTNGATVDNAASLFFNWFEVIITNTPEIMPLHPLCKYQAGSALFIGPIRIVGSGILDCTQFAIPKYMYTKNLLVGSGMGGEYNPEYTDTIQLFRNIVALEDSQDETSTMINSIMDQLMEHQITSEQFWNE